VVSHKVPNVSEFSRSDYREYVGMTRFLLIDQLTREGNFADETRTMHVRCVNRFRSRFQTARALPCLEFLILRVLEQRNWPNGVNKAVIGMTV
jgi:hypothetical protein